MEIKDFIKSRRIELGLTQAEVSKACQVSEGTVSRWESGDIENMKRSRIAALAKILRVDPTVLMQDSIEEQKEDVEIHTIAAHAIRDLTDEDVEEIMKFAKYLKSKYKDK